MALLVQKFGGSSVADIERIKYVAAKISRAYQAGHKLVVVVSAMAGETDKLLSMANKVSGMPAARELDVLLSTGEQVSIALLSMALIDLGCPAKSYTGSQVKIITDKSYNKARILDIERRNIKADLAAGKILIIAGFQGSDLEGNLTTLGRGGSDTTAVALAVALSADECQIYTDVDGVYTADPRVIVNARRMNRVSFDEMLELSSLGAKILQIRAVELAGKYKIPLRVLSTFADGPGTLISYEDDTMERQEITGLAHNRHEALIKLRGMTKIPGLLGKIFSPIADANIEIDMITQIEDQSVIDLAFTVHRSDLKRVMQIVPLLMEEFGGEFETDAQIAKLSLVGVGLRSQAGVVSKMLRVLGDHGLNIQLISSSETKVSVIVDEKHIELGLRVLHEAFNLSEEPLSRGLTSG